VPGEGGSPLPAPPDPQLAVFRLAEMDGVPKTTLFGVSLDALGLCLAGAGGYETPAVALAKQLLSSESTLSVGKGPTPCPLRWRSSPVPRSRRARR